MMSLATVFALPAATLVHAGPMDVQTEAYWAQVQDGALVALRDADGNVMIGAPAPTHSVGIRRVGQDHWATSAEGSGALRARQTATWRCRWTSKPGVEVPLLTGVEVLDYEEVIPVGKSTAAFADYTEALLGQNRSYHDQLLCDGRGDWRAGCWRFGGL